MKLFIFDTETTGLDHRRHGIIQLAAQVRIHGTVEDEFELFARPEDLMVEDQALAINERTREEIDTWPPRRMFHQCLLARLSKWIDRYNSADKLTPVAYNGWFDYQMLSEEFARQGDKYFGSWFNHTLIDPLPVIRFLQTVGGFRDLPNCRLATVADWMGIDTAGAHDAMADVRMLAAVVDGLREMVSVKNQHEARRTIMGEDEPPPKLEMLTTKDLNLMLKGERP